ncbi:MAG: NAD(P)-dependent oxidoreductase [Alphaproteobacteria bacterium]|nr:NAD(P)-dependent oxidoreductase [Alphaproteobacteria bacterium]
MSRWVLIGGAGLTGLKIAEELIEMNISKSNIIIADLKNSLSKINLQVALIECDISKNIIPKFKKDDVIIHLAARQYHTKIPKRNQLAWFREVNVVGTKNIINQCIKFNVKGLIYFSTDMVYGIPNYIPLNSAHPKTPIGPYGKSKLEAEMICIESRKRGLPITILRPRLIMGKGRLGIMEKLFKAISLNRPVPLIGRGNNCYQMVSVEDCSKAAILSVKHNFPNCELNLGSEVGPNIKKLLNFLIHTVNSKSILIPLPAFPLKIILTILEKMGLPILHKEQYKIADKNYIVDISDTYSKIRWKPKQSDTDMIVEAYKHWKNIQ